MNKNQQILLNFNQISTFYKPKRYRTKILAKSKNWFPIIASPKLAGIVGDLMGDGHLQGKPKWRLDYTSNSIKELKRFDNEIFNLFGIKGKIRDCTTNNYDTKNLGINNGLLARTLYLIGVPVGSKVLQNFLIPEWILDDKDCFSRFINRLFSCEGCIDLKSKYIECGMQKSENLLNEGIEFFHSIKEHLKKYFEIETTNPFLVNRVTIRKDGIKTRTIKFKIKKKESIIRYKNAINFDDPNKRLRLMKITS